jgi:hypothetical protein
MFAMHLALAPDAAGGSPGTRGSPDSSELVCRPELFNQRARVVIGAEFQPSSAPKGPAECRISGRIRAQTGRPETAQSSGNSVVQAERVKPAISLNICAAIDPIALKALPEDAPCRHGLRS